MNRSNARTLIFFLNFLVLASCKPLLTWIAGADGNVESLVGAGVKASSGPTEDLLRRHTVVLFGGSSFGGAWPSCTGGLVDDEIILTAAHCVTGESSPRIQVRQGAVLLSQNMVDDHNVNLASRAVVPFDYANAASAHKAAGRDQRSSVLTGADIALVYAPGVYLPDHLVATVGGDRPLDPEGEFLIGTQGSQGNETAATEKKTPTPASHTVQAEEITGAASVLNIVKAKPARPAPSADGAKKKVDWTGGDPRALQFATTEDVKICPGDSGSPAFRLPGPGETPRTLDIIAVMSAIVEYDKKLCSRTGLAVLVKPWRDWIQCEMKRIRQGAPDPHSSVHQCASIAGLDIALDTKRAEKVLKAAVPSVVKADEIGRHIGQTISVDSPQLLVTYTGIFERMEGQSIVVRNATSQLYLALSQIDEVRLSSNGEVIFPDPSTPAERIDELKRRVYLKNVKVVLRRAKTAVKWLPAPSQTGMVSDVNDHDLVLWVGRVHVTYPLTSIDSIEVVGTGERLSL